MDGEIIGGFGLLILVIWLRSSLSALTGDEGIGFKAVHFVLAAVSIGFGLVMGRIGFKRLSGCWGSESPADSVPDFLVFLCYQVL